MRKLSSLFLTLFCLVGTITSQNKKSHISESHVELPPQRTCSTMEVDAILRANNPSMGTLDDFENWIKPHVEQYKNSIANERGARVVYNIPVVVHVIHNGEAVGSQSNISLAQINSQIDVLNEDYRKLNADRTKVPSAFQSRHADVEINFCMALRDPSGNTLTNPGVDRVNRSSKGFSAPPYGNTTYIDGTIKPATIWDPTKYLNMWVLNLGGGLLGYAQFPNNTASLGGLSASGGSANTDGVVMLYSAFGRVGTLSAPYNRGRTATHEVGHWLGLRHIWGDGNCSVDDFCADTPTMDSENYGCPTYPGTQSCSNGGDMWMNYMDYVDDVCMYMFTNDQKARVQAVMAAGTPRRSSLATSTVCTPLTQRDAAITAIVKPTGSSCLTTFSPIVTLGNMGSNPLTSVTINYRIDGGTTYTYPWIGNLASSAIVNVTLPSMTTTVGAHTFTSFTSNPNGGADQNTANDQSIGSFTIVSAPSTVALPFFEGFENTTFIPNGWVLENPDNNNTWTRVTTANGFGNSTASARMDNYSGNINIAGQIDNMVTPSFNFSTAVSPLKMDFNVAHARYNNTYSDSLFVEITTDCGSSWTRLWAKGGDNLSTAAATTSGFVPTNAQWRAESINLNAYIGVTNAKFRFQSLSGYGNLVYVDDINLYYPSNLPVAQFTSPTSACVNQSVAFTDQTTNTPTSWSWTFTGGSPSTSSQQNPTVTYTTPGVYTVSLTATNASGSNTNTKTSYITVNALPTINVTPSSPSICNGSSTSLTASGASTYSWSPSSGLSATTGSTVSANPSSNTTYTVTGTSALGCVNTKDVTVTVIANPSVSVSPSSSTICSGGSVLLTASGATTYSWSPAIGLSSTTGAVVTANPGSTTTYKVVGTTSGCKDSTNVTITVNPTPTVLVSSSNGTICLGDSATLTASGATIYSWSPSTGLSATTGAVVKAKPTSTTTYSVIGITNGCSDTASVTINVNPVPTISVSPSAPIVCQGASVNLTASGATTYSWSPSTGLNITTGASVTSTPANTITYVVTGTAAGCSNTANVIVTVEPTPTISVNPSTPTICEGNSTTLTASGASTYVWSPSTGLSSTTGSVVTANPISNTTYAINGISANGCVGSGSVTVTVTPKFTLGTSSTLASCNTSDGTGTVTVTGGAAPINYLWNDPLNQSTSTATGLASGSYQVIVSDNNGCLDSISLTVNNAAAAVSVNPVNPIICRGDSVTLTASGADTYTWSPAGGLNTTSGASVIAFPNNNRTYTVVGTTAGCSNSTTVTVTVNNLPNISVSPNNPSICSGQSVTLNASGGSSYNWTPPAGLNITTGNSVVATPSGSTSYTVSGTDLNGCSNTASTTVTVNALPNVTVISTSDTICSGQSATLTASGATTYSWGPSLGLNTTNGASVIASPTSTTTYMVSGTTGACSNTANIKVNVKASPVITITPPATICEGSSTAITASGATSYTWSPALGLNVTSGASVIASPINTTNYIVTGTTNGCSSTASSMITVEPLPNVSINPASSTICEGNNVTLIASGATSYSWNPSADLNTTNGSTVIATPTITNTYTVTGTQGACSNSANVTVTVEPKPIVTLTPSNTICNGTSINLIAGGATSYSWSPATGLSSTTGNSVIANPSGTTTYMVNGTTNGCTGTNSVTVTVNPALVLNSNSTMASCGINDGSAIVTPSGGNGTYFYLWNDALAQVTPTASNLDAGLYQAIVTDGIGCKDSVLVTVNNPTPIVAITPSSAVICNGESVNLTASGADSFSWSPSTGLNVSTGANVIASPTITTTYTALGTTSNCTNSKTITITVNSLPSIVVAPASPTICVGETINFTANGANTYSWNEGVTFLSAGSTYSTSPSSNTVYTITGTDNNGCSNTINVPITVGQVPVVTVSADKDVLCVGESSVLTAGGATSYSWSPTTGLSSSTGTSVTATPNSTITYIVTGTTSGCSATASQTITVNPIPFVNASASPSSLCEGGTTLLTASGATSYTWSPSTGLSSTTGNSVSATPSTSLTYTVVGSDGNCSTSVNIPVTVIAKPTITVNPTSVSICSGGSTVLAASGGSTYSWSPITGLNSANAPSVTASPSMNTTYTVTGSNGTCSNTASVVVTVNQNPIISVSPNSASICSGGSVSLTAIGGSTYTWSNSGTLSSPTGSSVAASPTSTTTYMVTGTNANGCSGVRNVTVSVVGAPSVSIVPSNTTICEGDSVQLMAVGASSYTWFPTSDLSSSNSDIVYASPTSTITYTVTGSSPGCASTSNANVTVNVNPKPNVSVNPSAATICSGKFEVLSASGASTYLWSPSTGLSSNAGASVVAAPTSNMTYTVTGTTSFGCKDSASSVITVEASPVLTLTPASATICIGESIALGASGATTYTWSPSSSLSAPTGSSVTATPSSNTTYSVIGTTGNCTASKTVTVNVGPLPLITVSSDKDTICEGETVNLSANGASTYSWSPTTGLNTTTGATVSATPSSTITYIVTGTIAGCSKNASVDIFVKALPKMTISPDTLITICEGSSITITANGATDYSWSPALGLDTTIGAIVTATPNLPRTYLVTGTLNGCVSSKNVTVNLSPKFTITTSTFDEYCGNGAGSATAFVTGGGSLSYQWDDANLQTTSTASNLSSGIYSLVVSDNYNCVDSVDVEIYSINPLSLTFGSSDVSCKGLSDGMAIVNVLGATDPIQYNWDDISNQTSDTASGLVKGTYSVTVTDSDGCTLTDTVSVQEPEKIVLNTTFKNVTCNASNGEAYLSVNGGVEPYIFQWNDQQNQVTDTALQLSAGTYTVVVTDANNCSETLDVNIGTIGVMNLQFTTTDASCYNGNDGNATVSVSGGTGPYTYQWSDSSLQTSLTAVNLPAGMISVTVLDKNNCEQTENILILEAAMLETEPTLKFASCGFENGQAIIAATGGTSPYTVNWTKGGYTSDTLNNLGEGLYNFTITDSKGCVLLDSVYIENLLTDSCVFIPNAFSPNGDNDHDSWIFNNIHYYTKVKVEVFNRWGNQVYVNENYDNKWDGTYNGNELPGGVYFYVIDLNNGQRTLNGNVTILR